jgi:hypothetical protein
MAQSTNIVEFKPTPAVIPQFGSETSAALIELGQRKPPSIVIATEIPVDAAQKFSLGEYPQAKPHARLTQSELYPIRAAFSRNHITALRLLTLAIGRVKRGMDALSLNDIIAADIEIQKVQVLLPELFCCRTLGDGFGTIVNSIISAFEALAGETPSVKQLRAMAQSFQMLKDKPFLSTEEADAQVEKMESVGLSAYPQELMEFLSSE